MRDLFSQIFAKKLVLTTVCILLLAGCSDDNQVIFENNLECQDKTSQMKDKLDKHYDSDYEQYEILHVFYSPKFNQCLYSYKASMTPENPNHDPLFDDGYYEIRRLGEEGVYQRFDNERKDGEDFFYDVIEELKGN